MVEFLALMGMFGFGILIGFLVRRIFWEDS